MPRDITITFEDGTTHVYKNAPDDVTPKSVYDRASKEFSGKKIVNVDGGRRGGAAAPAAAAEPEASFGQQVLRGAASTADILAEAIPGTAAMIAYPFRRAAGIVTGETAEDIAASQERVLGAVAQPVGRATGVAETPGYQENALRQAVTFVAENLDKGADYLSEVTGLPKSDVANMMQVALTAGPFKVTGAVAKEVPGGAAVVRGAKKVAETPKKVTTATINKMRDVIDPKTKFYMDVAEGRGAELIRAARAPEAEVIPGVRPTFAQATADVGLPRVAAVGEQAAKLQPTEALRVKDIQEAGRVSELRKIEQTPEVRAKAEKARERRSEPLYREAETAGDVVDVQPTLDYIDGLVKTNPGNPALLAELRRIRKGLVKRELDENGDPVLVPRTDAKEIASTLDGIKSALAKEDNRFIKKELTNIKDDLVEAIPSMKEAQEAFRKGSKPINQMDVGTYLREKLEAPVQEGTQRATVFANAVREAPRTLKQALDGAPRYEKLTEVLSPPQMARVDRVMMDLSRDARVKELVQMGREAAPELAKPLGKIDRPNLINRVWTIANLIFERLEGKINEKMAMDIALEFLDARKAADALETAMRRSGGRGAAAPARRPSGPISSMVKRAPVTTSPNTMTEENRNRMSR
jgi:hypothetical protein